MIDAELEKHYNATYLTFEREINRILSELPLINVPIKAPKLLTKLSLPEPNAIDSYALIRNYLIVIKFLEQLNKPKGKLQTCLNWFSEEINKGSLKFAELKNFIAYSRWKTEDTTQLDYLVDCFKQERLTPSIFLDKCKDLIDLEFYDAPWSKNKVFVEDIMKIMNKSTSTLQNYLQEYFNRLNDEPNESKYVGTCYIIYRATIYLINLYEKTIIHLLYKQECNAEFEHLLTVQEEYDSDYFREVLLKSVDVKRSKLTAKRKKETEVIEMKIEPVQHEIRGMPTVDDLNTYIAHFDWSIK